MRVRAKQAGYDGIYRYPGDEFDVPAGFKASWVEVVGEAEASPSTPESITEEITEITVLRAEYAAVVGKKPYHGWGAPELAAKITAAEKSQRPQ